MQRFSMYELLASFSEPSALCDVDRLSSAENARDEKTENITKKTKMIFKRIIMCVALLGVASVFSACTTTKNTTNTNTRTAADDITDTVDAVTGIGAVKIKENTDPDLATAKAKELWRARFQSGEDLSNGPCLSNEAIPGWVADIAHSPRQAVDDLPENQCSAYRDGTAKHFVELDPEGNLIRAE